MSVSSRIRSIDWPLFPPNIKFWPVVSDKLFPGIPAQNSDCFGHVFIYGNAIYCICLGDLPFNTNIFLFLLFLK